MSLGILNPTVCTNLIQGYDTTVTSGATLTLTSASNQQQYFTGTQTHTVVLPITSTLVLGMSYSIVNNSTQAVSVQSSGGNVILSVLSLTSNVFTCILTTGTTAASWNIIAVGATSITGTTNQITVTPSTGNVTVGLPSAVTIGSLTLSGLTASQAVVTDGADQLASLNDVATATASTIALRDANANILASNIIEGYTTTVTAAGTTTLTVASSEQQYFTGTNIQTVLLPVTSTLVLGQSYTITNNSTGLVTILSSGSNVVSILNPGVTNTLTCILTSGTTAASWSGGNIGTYAVGSSLYGICFDGTNIWISNAGSNTVTKLLASTGALVGTYTAVTIPYGICFDGTNIWISNSGSVNVTKLLASTGALVGTYTVGTNPYQICFDGTNIWATNYTSANVTKITEPNLSPAQVKPSTIGIPFLSTFDNVSRDLYANTQINNLIPAYSTTATAAGTSALSAMSPYQQYFTGTTTHTVTLPDVTTLTLGHSFKIVNRSTGTVTVNSSGGNLLVSLTTMTWGRVVCILESGTTSASWSYEPGSTPVI